MGFRTCGVVLFAMMLAACGSDSKDASGGSGGHAGTSGSGGSDASAGTGGSGGAGASGGTSGAGGSGGTPITDAGPVEPPIVCTDQCLYVQPGSAAGGDGSDWDKAFGSLPKPLLRGKVYFIADGDYASYTFDDAPSGSDVVTIRKATPESHGTDTGWQADFGDGVAKFSGGIAFESSYYVLDGARGGGPGAWLTGHGIEIVSIGAACKDNGSLIRFGAGVSDVTVKHVHAHGEKNDYPIDGFKGTSGASNLVFTYVALHTTFGPAFHMGDWHDVVIEKSYLADVRSTGAGDPFCSDWHAEGISSIGTNQNIVIRNNLWNQIGGTAVFAGVNGGASKDWKIYGNVIAASVTTLAYYNESGTSNQQTMDGLEFHHNAIVHMPGSSQGALLIQAGANNKVFNNVWYDNVANAFGMGSLEHDFNLYAKNRREEGCTPACDKNAEAAEGETSAQIVSTSPFVAGDGDPVTADFHLSSATQAGKTLGAPFDVDPDGKVRGADGSWDRGVYEFGP